MFLCLLKPQRGIAIGPILFVVAILAVLVGALSSGMGSFGGNATIDRIKSDVRGQANLIRAKIQECYMTTMGSSDFGWPPGPTPNGTLLQDIICPGDPSGMQNIWRGARPTSIPVNPVGFKDWVYFNYDHGRCLILVPTDKPSQATKDGMMSVSKYFGERERFLDPSDYSLSIWLTPLEKPMRCGT